MVHKEPLFHFVNAGVDFGALQYRIILSEYLSQLGAIFERLGSDSTSGLQVRY